MHPTGTAKQFPEHADALLCDQLCVRPKLWWSNKRFLGGSVLILRELAETTDTAAVPIIATKQPITPSIPIAMGWITRLMTSAYKIRDRGPFEFCLHFEFYFYPFYPFSVYLQAKHDSFCA